MKFYTAIALFGAASALKLREEVAEEEIEVEDADVLEFYEDAADLCKELGLVDEDGEVPVEDLAWHLDEASRKHEDDGVLTLDEAAEYIADELLDLDEEVEGDEDLKDELKGGLKEELEKRFGKFDKNGNGGLDLDDFGFDEDELDEAVEEVEDALDDLDDDLAQEEDVAEEGPEGKKPEGEKPEGEKPEGEKKPEGDDEGDDEGCPFGLDDLDLGDVEEFLGLDFDELLEDVDFGDLDLGLDDLEDLDFDLDDVWGFVEDLDEEDLEEYWEELEDFDWEELDFDDLDDEDWEAVDDFLGELDLGDLDLDVEDLDDLDIDFDDVWGELEEFFDEEDLEALGSLEDLEDATF